RKEEGTSCAEYAPCRIAPAHTGTCSERMLDLLLSLDHGGYDIERSGQINRTVLYSKDHGLFWRHTEFPCGRAIIDEAIRRLSECPLADISLRQSARPFRQL